MTTLRQNNPITIENPICLVGFVYPVKHETSLPFDPPAMPIHQTSSTVISATPTDPILVPSTTPWEDLFATSENIYHQFIEPKLTPQGIATVVTSSITFAAYFSVDNPYVKMDSSFVGKGLVAIGFKLFTTMANPLVAQFVEPAIEKHFTNAQIVQQKINELFNKNTESVNEATALTPVDLHSVEVDGSSFNFVKLYQDIAIKVNDLSLKGLATTGFISACAGNLQELGYALSGFNNLCESSFCKDWFTYYLKEGLKIGINETMQQIPLPEMGDNTDGTNGPNGPIHLKVISGLPSPENSSKTVDMPLDIKDIIITSDGCETFLFSDATYQATLTLCNTTPTPSQVVHSLTVEQLSMHTEQHSGFA
ncbi:MAG: hypothetical protein ACHQJ6_00540 [Candidatus Berkiellales bacterium]